MILEKTVEEMKQELIDLFTEIDQHMEMAKKMSAIVDDELEQVNALVLAIQERENGTSS